MPLFDYRCTECGHAFETLASGPDDKVRCPKCDSRKTERQLSLPARPVAAAPAGPCGVGPPCGVGCRRTANQ